MCKIWGVCTHLKFVFVGFVPTEEGFARTNSNFESEFVFVEPTGSGLTKRWVDASFQSKTPERSRIQLVTDTLDFC